MTPSKNIVLAIDPGYDRLGVAVIEEIKGKQTLLYSDCVTTDKKLIHAKRLALIGAAVSELIETWEPKTIAIEELFFSKNVKTAMLVSQALGVITYEAAKRNLRIFFYKPVQIKVAVTGYGASDKTHVLNMVPRLIKMDSRKRHDDEYDAVAIGITHLASYRQHSDVLSTEF